MAIQQDVCGDSVMQIWIEWGVTAKVWERGKDKRQRGRRGVCACAGECGGVMRVCVGEGKIPLLQQRMWMGWWTTQILYFKNLTSFISILTFVPWLNFWGKKLLSLHIYKQFLQAWYKRKHWLLTPIKAEIWALASTLHHLP